MRFHVVSLPHTQTTREYVHCAYTEKVRKFCDMMMDRGHEVYLYAGDQNEAKCTELITTVTRSSQKVVFGIDGPKDNLKFEFNPSGSAWKTVNRRVIREIGKRAKKKDFICLIAGACQKEIADAFPSMISVEYGVGYSGVFSPYKVFESYAWMHTVYGAMMTAHGANGNAFDDVIPNYYDPVDFPFQKKKDDYFLYIGRLIDRKGYQIASDVCKILGKKLIIAGQGTPPEYGEYVGLVDTKERGKLMSKAQAVFVPTQYVEPFGGVSAEAMLCGTPVITTDWGAFTENIADTVTGFRCRTLSDFVHAARNVGELSPRQIRHWALAKFSIEVVGEQYEEYFKRLLTLWDKGWYQLDG